MRGRAREILATYSGDIHVLWSGGMYTTALVTAFILETENDLQNRNRIIIRYCERSIPEYPLFFEQHVSRLRYRVIDGHVRDIFDGQKNSGNRRSR